MHGQEEFSIAPRVTCTVVHALSLGTAAWLYFGGGNVLVSRWLGLEQVDVVYTARSVWLLTFGAVLLLRISLSLFYILKRKFGWDELGGVLFALLLYQVGFALLSLHADETLGALDWAAIIIFFAGSTINTTAELQRKQFKDRPVNKGKLYTGGLFRYARHINYMGDILWVTGWAMMTRNIWSATIPVLLTAGFVFFFIPSLSKHLQTKYSEQYEQWAKTTNKLVPFIY